MDPADGKFHKTVQLFLRCRGDSPDIFMAKIQEVLRTKPLTPVEAPSPSTLPAVPIAPKPEPENSVQKKQFVDNSLLQQLLDMVIAAF